MGQNAGPIGSNGYEMGTNPPVKLVIAAFLLLSVQSVIAETLTGRIVSIADGDTVTLLDANLQQHKIRLSGIDAPEKRQPFGNRSRLHLGALAVLVQLDAPAGHRRPPAEQRGSRVARNRSRSRRRQRKSGYITPITDWPQCAGR